MRKISGVSRTQYILIVTITVVIFASFVGIYEIGLLHFGSQNVKLIGQCHDTTYIASPTVTAVTTNVTITSDDTTSYFQWTVTGNVSTYTNASSSYTTTTFAHNSSSYVITNTTDLTNDIPLAVWVVSTCTFTPQDNLNSHVMS